MSGVGVGSKEMYSVLIDNGQLLPLHLMLNDLKTKLGYVTSNRHFSLIYLHGPYRNQELENRKAGRLPPAFGSARMLELVGRSRTDRLDPLTKFKLFERKNVIGPSDSIPEGTAPSRSRRMPRVDDDSNEQIGTGSTLKTLSQLPPLLANETLAEAVSQVQVPMDDEWESPHLFKLVVVLVEPPPGLDLNAIEGLHEYLTLLNIKMGRLVDNGVRSLASHCWCTLLGKCSRPNISRV